MLAAMSLKDPPNSSNSSLVLIVTRLSNFFAAILWVAARSGSPCPAAIPGPISVDQCARKALCGDLLPTRPAAGAVDCRTRRFARCSAGPVAPGRLVGTSLACVPTSRARRRPWLSGGGDHRYPRYGSSASPAPNGLTRAGLAVRLPFADFFLSSSSHQVVGALPRQPPLAAGSARCYLP